MKITLPEGIRRRDPLADAQEAMAVRVEQHPRLCDPDWSIEETPMQAAMARLVRDLGARISALMDLAAAADDPRGILITYRAEGDSVYADYRLSDEVPSGQVESRGGLS